MAQHSRRSAGGLALGALALVLIGAPLAFPVSEIPGPLKGDEAAYYLLALSLWHDGDARCDEPELGRLFAEFPAGAETLWLLRTDGGKAPYFGVPFLYALVVAPAVAVAGARGILVVNAALFAAMLGMGAAYLRRFNARGPAVLFAALFFVLSAAAPYVFWLQGEIFVMGCLTLSLFLLLRRGSSGAGGRDAAGASPLAAGGSGALMAVVVYLRPPMGLVGIALLTLLLLRARRRAVAAWCLAALLVFGAVCATSELLVGEPWVYATPNRRSVSIVSPVAFAERKIQPLQPRDSEVLWSGEHFQTMTRPRFGSLRHVAVALSDFLIGRHVGLIPYLPFAVLSVVLLVTGRGGGWRWLLLGMALLSGVAWQWYLPGAWAGGGGYFGNRYLVAAYPAFLFLVTRVRPLWSVVPAAGVAALFLGSGLATAAQPGFGAVRQTHALGTAHLWLPQELTLATLPGYRGSYHSGAWLRAHAGRTRPQADEIWFAGGTSTDAWLFAARPLEDAHFAVRSPAPANRVEICLEGACSTLDFEGRTGTSDTRSVSLEPGDAYRTLPWRDPPLWVYRLRVTSRAGEQPRWRQGGNERFYLGAAVAYLGSSDEQQRGVFHAAWEVVEPPEVARAGQTFEIPVSVRNTSASSWDDTGATRIQASYHWEKGDGSLAVWDGRRTPLPAPVGPGEAAALRLQVSPPAEPGDYVLVLDLVRERVAWFSQRDATAAYRLPLRVAAP